MELQHTRVDYYKNVALALNLTPIHERHRNIWAGKPAERLLKVYVFKNHITFEPSGIEFNLQVRNGSFKVEQQIKIQPKTAARLFEKIGTLEPRTLNENEEDVNGILQAHIEFTPFVNGKKAFLVKKENELITKIEFTSSEISNLANYTTEIKAELFTIKKCCC